MTALAARARAGGFSLLAEVAERMAQAAIEVKIDRLPPLVEDLELAIRCLHRLMGFDRPSAGAPSGTVTAILSDSPDRTRAS